MKFDLAQIKKLYDQGYAFHWLRPRSKIPVKKGWSTGPRASWADFKRDYNEGCNLGVRLGTPSKVDGGFLAVVDLDIKSDDSKSHSEATAALLKAYPQVKKGCPVVLSGRGNGSAHYYVRTKEPIAGPTIRSPRQVRVTMPSASPSQKDRDSLTPEEIASGVRLRAAWEISLLSSGRQVVFKGSIHPDTGNVYKASRAFNGIASLPFVEGNTPAAIPPAPVVAPAPSLQSLGLRRDQIEAIESGVGVVDRSASLFSLCLSMLKKGIDENSILSIFTDRKYFLGLASYDHAQTTDPKRAAAWVEKYCIRKASEKVSETVFEVTEEVKRKPYLEKLEWNAGKGKAPKLKVTLNNILMILQNEVSSALLRKNLFTGYEEWNAQTPWGCKPGQKRSGGLEDVVGVKTWLSQNFNFEPQVSLIEEALIQITKENAYHPVRDFLNALEWDGIERVEKVFHTYMGAQMPEEYLRAVSRKFFLALVSRAFRPGCKFDFIPVLEGLQGIGKSTFGRTLVGDDWFLDNLPPLEDKDAALYLQGVWLCEMSELSSLYRSKIETTKAFISRTVDKIRPPYGKRREDFPRSTVFLGSTNNADYLTDPTGNRRYWPIHVTGCDFKALEKDRVQLLAEAKFMYDFAREPIYLTDSVRDQAEEIQDLHRADDDIDGMKHRFDLYLASKNGEVSELEKIQMDDLFQSGPWQAYPLNMGTRKAGGIVLRQLGYKRIHTMFGKRWVIESSQLPGLSNLKEG